jgi:hypothetical protein
VAAVAIALLLGIHVGAHSVTFTFSSAPSNVRTAYAAKPLAQCGSGLPVAVRDVHFVVHFQPARTALSFATQRRLKVAGVVRDAAKTCDFESDLAWAFGLDRRRAYHVTRSGPRVTVTFSS